MKQVNFLKQTALFAAIMCVCSLTATAQLNGTYTVGGASPDYSTLSAAISALNSSGVNGPVDFVIRDGSYSGTSWRGIINNVSGASATNRITFRSQGGNKNSVTISANSSGNYIFRFNGARYITVKNMTLKTTNTSYQRLFDYRGTASYNNIENCSLEGRTTTSSSNARALVYMNSGHTGTDNKFDNCNFLNGGTWVYMYGSNTSSTSNNALFTNNSFSSTNSTYYGIYTYYVKAMHFDNNTFSRTGSGYFYLFRSYYTNEDFEFTNNDVNIATNGSYLYGFYMYYNNYYNTSTTSTPLIEGNTMNLNNTTSYIYPFYTYYMYYGTVKQNTINTTVTTGRIYYYGPIYYGRECLVEDNTFNLTGTSSGYGYTQYFAINSSNAPNTVTRNIFNFDCRYNYNYISYYGNTVITHNEYNLTTTTGANYNYMYYPNGLEFAYNKITTRANSGTTYGLYDYNTTSYSGANIHHNVFDCESNTGTVYGAYPYYSKSTYTNNVFTTKTAGTNYTMNVRYTRTPCAFYNNTFHSNATGNTNYAAYIYNTSSSYDIELKNNIFSKVSNKGYGIWIYNKAYVEADYNIYDAGGSTTFYCNNPSYNGNSLQSWRDKTGSDMNSLVYDVPYVNAANKDFHIDPTSPAAWAVNGRAEQDTSIKIDMDSMVRPYLVQDGVPDLGAYEVMPTSTPPNATAVPANPVANSTQVFTFGQDTVGTIDWGATVPSTFTVRQYTGAQAGPMPTGVGRMYFYTAGTPSSYVHNYSANIYYKDAWIGDIPTESEAVIARSSNGGAWEGYNYSNANTNTAKNILSAAAPFDSVGGYTGVQNGRIGIRCVEDPMNVQITNVTAFAADVDWNPVFNPVGYQVVLKKQLEAPSQTEWNNASLPTTNSIALGGLEEDTKYYVYIRSICGVKDTSGHTLDSFTTLITCHTPDVQVTGVNDSRVVAFWNDIKTAVKYEYVLTNSSATPSFGTDLNKTSVLNTILDDDKEYFVHVRAHCSSIYPESNWASTSFKTWKLGIGDVSGDGVKMNIYPNPVHNEMTVTVGEVTGVGTLTLMDMTGKVLKVMPVSTSKVTIQTGDLPAGTYIAQFADDANRQQVKFNKQ